MLRVYFVFALLQLFILTGCSATSSGLVKEKPPYFELTSLSNDPEYGKIETKPIKVGGIMQGGGHGGQRWFFSMLRGPKGENLEVGRISACCFYETPNGYKGKGALDKWQVRNPASGETVVLHLNSYEFEAPKIPVGFTSTVTEKNAAHQSRDAI